MCCKASLSWSNLNAARSIDVRRPGPACFQWQSADRCEWCSWRGVCLCVWLRQSSWWVFQTNVLLSVRKLGLTYAVSLLYFSLFMLTCLHLMKILDSLGKDFVAVCFFFLYHPFIYLLGIFPPGSQSSPWDVIRSVPAVRTEVPGKLINDVCQQKLNSKLRDNKTLYPVVPSHPSGGAHWRRTGNPRTSSWHDHFSASSPWHLMSHSWRFTSGEYTDSIDGREGTVRTEDENMVFPGA